MEKDSARPHMLVVDDTALHRTFATTVLEAAGWRVSTAADGRTALAALESAMSLVLMDLHIEGMGGLEIAAAIRQHGDATAAVAILAYTTTRLVAPEMLIARGFDGFVAKPCTPSELVAAAARWKPAGATVLARLETELGEAAIRGVTAGFRDLLVEALVHPAGAALGLVAHRVAGLAGTLGFAAAGRAWLAVSEGDESALPEARREARRAIAAIDRQSRSSEPTTSV